MEARIFIVEDEMILNKHLSNFLSSYGYTVEMASRGEECLEKLKSHPLPDLILMDINLGKNRMDGPATTQKIYEQYDIPVVLHSAYTDKATLDTTRDMVKYGYIQKVPGNEQFILAGIELALKLHAAQKAHIQSEAKYRKLLHRSQDIREEQNAHIAREVHDELGQTLTSLQMGLALINNDLKGRRTEEKCASVAQMIGEMHETISEAIDKTRSLSSQLRPAVLDTTTLMDALKWLVQDYERRMRIPINLMNEKEHLELSREKSLAVYRIVQEALTNIARYANASQVSVEPLAGDSLLEIYIQDNGSGFNVEALELNGSLGILGMKERANQFGGDVIIESRAGEGTKVYMYIQLDGEVEP